MHFANNFFFLLLFGWHIERSFGRLTFLGIFFGAMVVGHIAFITFNGGTVEGISGGVCGLFGFSLISQRGVPWWTTLWRPWRHALYVATLIASIIIDVFDFVPYPVAHSSHAGGIVYGLAFAGAFFWAPRGSRWRMAVLALPPLFFAMVFLWTLTAVRE